MLIEIDDGRLRVGTELAGSGAEGIGSLQRMPALHRFAATRTGAAVDVELPHDGLARNLGLVLLINVGFVDFATAFGTGIRQRRFMDFVDLLRWRYLAMAMPAVTPTAFAARSLGMFLGRILGERRRLALGSALVLVEQSRKLLDPGLEFGDLLPQRFASGACFRHARSIANVRFFSCASSVALADVMGR